MYRLLSVMFSGIIRVVACISASFLFMAGEYSIVWLYRIFSIHSSVDGHLDCFHFLAVVNRAAMNVHVPVFESLFAMHLATYLGVELLGCAVIPCLTFQRTAKLFSTVADPFYIPTSSI